MFHEHDFYSATQQLANTIWRAVIAAGQSNNPQGGTPPPPPPVLFQLRAGFAESPGWYMAQMLEFDPEPVTIEKLRVRDIYASPALVGALLELMRSEGWITAVDDGLILASKGRELIDKRRASNRQNIEKLNLSSIQSEIDTVASHLENIINLSQEIGVNGASWCLDKSRNRAPAEPTSSVAKIMQFTADFNAFRDDAHMAAFQPLDISGHAWEAFSFVWQGTANTAIDINEKLYFRGHSAAIYGRELDKLHLRGWLDKTEERYTMTASGTEARVAAEKKTDGYFYAPWQAANVDPIELKQLLGTITAALTAE